MVEQTFECMRCKAITPLMQLPAQCPKCGGGTGVLREVGPREPRPDSPAER